MITTLANTKHYIKTNYHKTNGELIKMNIIKFAETELKVSISNFQLDLLVLLENDSDAWHPKLKPATHEVKMVLDIYTKWKECQNSPVAC
jgi:hypothetical protein